MRDKVPFMVAVVPFSDEQARLLVNLGQRYALWIAAEQALTSMPYDLKRKLINGHYYLYEVFDRIGNGKSLGRWSDDAARQYDEYRVAKSREKQRRESGRALLDESARLYRALRLPLLSSDAGPIRAGDWIGIVRGDGIVAVTGSLDGVTTALLEHIVSADHEMVTVIEGVDATAGHTAAIQNWLAEHRPDAEVEVHRGGQPLYPYLFGVE